MWMLTLMAVCPLHWDQPMVNTLPREPVPITLLADSPGPASATIEFAGLDVYGVETGNGLVHWSGTVPATFWVSAPVPGSYKAGIIGGDTCTVNVLPEPCLAIGLLLLFWRRHDLHSMS